MCNKVCNCQFSMASDDRNCGSSWRRFGQVSHQAGPSGSLHCLAARHSVTAMASSILAVSKYRNMFFFKYIFFQYCFMLCAYASHVLSIDRAEKELEGFSCRLNPFHCGIGYCGIVVAQYCGIGYWGIAVLGIVALVIVQTESIPSSRDSFHSHVQVGSNVKSHDNSLAKVMSKKTQADLMHLSWAVQCPSSSLFQHITRLQDTMSISIARFWGQRDCFLERLWLKNSRHYNTRPFLPTIQHNITQWNTIQNNETQHNTTHIPFFLLQPPAPPVPPCILITRLNVF